MENKTEGQKRVEKARRKFWKEVDDAFREYMTAYTAANEVYDSIALKAADKLKWYNLNRLKNWQIMALARRDDMIVVFRGGVVEGCKKEGREWEEFEREIARAERKFKEIYEPAYKKFENRCEKAREKLGGIRLTR